ncbi:TonB-dependent receptor [Steroidobacter sp. S1-65]|uniref:TonB-dependent receptor n=1 Tax=Steroidobacter gossypii TaxID=2805490 RepID=A0ABS1X184_9GAMM|nr:TonB-dependent receptor [Steroidobacter gossypii]MBM0106982.1 TonB-dependent receptor [Steroidobacter gossypii]
MQLSHSRAGLSALVASIALALASPAQAQSEAVTISMATQSLDAALNVVAQQSGVDILFSPADVAGQQAPALQGEMSALQAVQALIAGTPLEVVTTSSRALIVRRKESMRLALATDSPTSVAAASGVEEVVVTGTAFQNQEAVANRRRSLTIVDTLTQDDTGDLADKSLADALSRVSGVSTMQVLYGEQESQYVAVRGITPDLNYVSVDGIGMISVANQGAGQRRVDLALIPSQAARTTEVFKTFTADLDSGAIGGIINIVPYSAFEGGEKFFVDTFASYATYNDVPGGNSPGGYRDSPWGGGIKQLWSQRFGSDRQFGVVLSSVYQQRSYDETKRNPNGRAYYTATGATTTPISPDYNGYDPAPTAFVSYDFTSFVENYGGSMLLEFSPSSSWYSSLMLYDYRQREDQTTNAPTLRAFTGITDQTQTTGTLRIPDVRTTFAYDRFDTESRGAIFKTRYEFANQSRLEFRAGYNDNTFDNPENEVIYQYRPTDSYVSYDTSGDSVSFTLSDPQSMLVASNYSLLSATDVTTSAQGEAAEARLDYSLNFDADSLGWGLKAGLGLRSFDMQRDLTDTTFTSDRSSLALAAYDPNYTPWMWNYPVLWIDYDAYNASVRPNLAVNAATSAANSLSQDYSYDETVSYGYISGTYATQSTRVIAGLRADLADYSADVPFSVGGVFQNAFQHYSGDYSYLLPSLNVLHDLSDRLRLKAGYSRTLGRPAPEDLARAETRNDTTFSISRGNPNLEPRRADNVDLALEYYLDGGSGLLSLGGFVKNIKDDIYALKQEQLVGGVPYTVSTPMNANESRLRGIEFQYIENQIPGLPGFLAGKLGASVNVSRMWGEMDYVVNDVTLHVDRLLFQRDWLANGALFYKLPRGGEVRVAYNYGDEYYDGIGADPWLHRGPQQRGQLDFTVRYRVLDEWIVKLQAVNLLDDNLNLGYGEALSMRRAEMKKGLTFYFNLIYKP